MFKIRFVIVAMIFFISSCGESTKYGKLENYFNDIHQFELSNDTKAIIVISERGGCLSCTQSFANFISDYIINTEILFIVCSPKGKIDISYFLQYKEQSNVFFDYNETILETELIKKSGVIFLKQNEVDTTIEIELETMKQSFETIHEYFKHYK
ncbi:MAG: hypothetical protein WDZ35_15555 [Crocinitomicaceae bacterium]